ncbi:MAG TPA: hypothetical protein VEH54_05895 [Steroidobacteraceae bacterium]|nr:hypothetical protein [Steroidobacteraceae bacterium]
MRISLPLAVFLLVLAAPARAERDPQSGAPLPPGKPPPANPITDHFFAQAAFFDPRFNTNLRVDPSPPIPGVMGTPVNAEDDLGLPDRQPQVTVELMFRMRNRNKVRLGYFESNRSGSKVLENDVRFGNEIFAHGELVDSSINFRMFDLTYTYSFYRSDRFEIGTGLAAYFVQLDAMGLVPATFQQQSVSAAEPIPALPLDFTWVISSRFAVTARGAYMTATLNGFHGWIVDSEETIQYRWLRNFAIGLGYTSTRMSLTKSTGSSPGVFGLSIGGLEAFVRFSF